MIELIEANWLVAVAALLLGLLVAWYVFHATRRTRVAGTRRDVLDDGAAPATRNSALIGAPPAAAHEEQTSIPAAPAGMVGVGSVVAAGAAEAHPDIAGTDDLTRIKGIGPKLVARLHELQITRFSQIAEWDDAEIEQIDAQLGRFSGRIRRDNWIEQARLLDQGDDEDFAARFGSLG